MTIQLKRKQQGNIWMYMQSNLKQSQNQATSFPGSLSYPSKDPVGSGHVSPRIWEITNT